MRSLSGAGAGAGIVPGAVLLVEDLHAQAQEYPGHREEHDEGDEVLFRCLHGRASQGSRWLTFLPWSVASGTVTGV